MSACGETKVVVGFDGTASGFDAVHLGRLLAEVTHASLLIAHVYPIETVPSSAVVFMGEVADAQLRHADETLSLTDNALLGVAHAKRAVPATSASRGLHELAEAEGADVLVVGSTHRHGPGRVVLGSTAQALVHGAPCSVAVAPAGWRDAGVERLAVIGVGLDGSAESQHALVAAAGLARVTGAPLQAIAVFRPRPPVRPELVGATRSYDELVVGHRERVQRMLDDAVSGVPTDVDLHAAVAEGDPATVLADRSAELDLLVLGARGYGSLRAVLLGSVSGALLERARCPVLVVPRGVERPSGVSTGELEDVMAQRPPDPRAPFRD